MAYKQTIRSASYVAFSLFFCWGACSKCPYPDVCRDGENLYVFRVSYVDRFREGDLSGSGEFLWESICSGNDFELDRISRIINEQFEDISFLSYPIPDHHYLIRFEKSKTPKKLLNVIDLDLSPQLRAAILKHDLKVRSSEMVRSLEYSTGRENLEQLVSSFISGLEVGGTYLEDLEIIENGRSRIRVGTDVLLVDFYFGGWIANGERNLYHIRCSFGYDRILKRYEVEPVVLNPDGESFERADGCVDCIRVVLEEED